MSDYLLQKKVLNDAESHMRCFAHGMNLAAQYSLCEIPSVSTVQDVVKAIKASPACLDRLREYCLKEDNVKFVKPVLDV
jgi:hypothetical protein